MADGNVQIHPAVERLVLRRQMAEAVEKLLDAVDVLVRELDSDAPDPDVEPTLGAPEYLNHLRIERGPLRDECFRWAKGGDVGEREAEADLEPSLALLGRRHLCPVSQGSWEAEGWCPRWEDREREHDGREPSLGSIGGTYNTSWVDQRRWAEGGDQGEREAVCEDEGSFRDGDDEPDQEGEGTANPQWQIAGRLMTEVDGPDTWRPIDPDDDPGDFVERCEVGLR